MKCPNCGGDVPSQSLACPYCGTANEEGIAFQEEIQKKIERNKLLKPFLIKQKTPELVQKMLTRILLILFGVNASLVVIALVFYMWGERKGKERFPAEGSMAEAYYDTFIEMDNYYFSGFLREANDTIEMIENGEMPESEDIEYLIRYAYYALEAGQEEEEAVREEIRLTVDAFFMGYLKLADEEMQALAPKEDGSYDYSVDKELSEQMKQAIEERLQEVIR